MKIIIGIDAGGSTTKIVGFPAEGGEIITPRFVKANDPVTSIYGALGNFTLENKINIKDIERIMVTGVGSSAVGEDLYGVPTQHVTEFKAIGLGGLYLSRLERALVVSMGTGTASVYAEGSATEYLGGTGVGGGTLTGLAGRILNMREIEHICALAKDGDLGKVDLRISDIKGNMLPSDMTAANFGKISEVATDGDIALGIINLVFETIGMIAIFASRTRGVKDIVLIGNLTAAPQAQEIFGNLSKLFDVNFIIPERSQYGTVIGAALSYFDKEKIK